MPPIMPSRYAGDEAFTALLQEVGCPMPLHEIKPFILGCLAATEVPKIDTILSTLWGGEVPPFDGLDQLNRFVGQLFALWNEIAAGLDDPEFPLTTALGVEQVPDVERHAALRQAEVMSFLRGLDAGYTDPKRLSADAKQAVDMLGQALHLWSEYERLSREKPTEGADSVGETAACLRELDQVAGDAIWVVVDEQRLARRREMQRCGPGGTYVRAAKPGRNDPCPCGSGKKYKKCCGKQ